MQLIKSSIFSFLLLYVLTDGLLIPTHRRYEVASGPEMLASEVFLSSEEVPGNMNGALPLNVANDLGHAVLWWNRDQHVNVVKHHVTFFNAALPLSRQLPKNRDKLFSKLFVECLPATFWDPYDMILAVPD